MDGARTARQEIRSWGTRASWGTSIFLTAEISSGVEFYTRVLGMRVTDWLGEGGVWFHKTSDHHVMALASTKATTTSTTSPSTSWTSGRCGWPSTTWAATAVG